MDRSNTLKVGLIGCGRVAQERHLPVLRSLAEVEVVAVADVDPIRLDMIANQFQVANRCADYRALLDDAAIDVVAVCVPAQFHAEVALAALDAGKHLFIEKPLALNLAESDQLVEKAARSASKVMVGFNLRWHPLVRQARAMLQRGTLGAIEVMRTVLTSRHANVPKWRKRRESGGGVLIEMAVHHYDLWRFLLGSEVEQVWAASRSAQRDDQTATVSARMTNGVLVDSVFSERTSIHNDVEIFGQAGRLRVSCYQFDGLEFIPAASEPGDIRTRWRRMARVLARLPLAALKLRQGGDFVGSYRSEWLHFIDAIQHDKPVECTLADGRRAMQIMVAVLEAAERGLPVKVASGE